MADTVDVFPIANGLFPPDLTLPNDQGIRENQGPRCARIFATLLASTNYTIDVGEIQALERLNNIQTMFVNNRDGANRVDVTTDYTGQVQSVPAGAFAYLSVMLGQGKTLTLNRADAGTLPVYLLNIPQPSIVWDADGNFYFVEKPCATATPANVAATGADVTLLAANTSRRAATIFNDATVPLYVNFGAAASATAFVTIIQAQGYYELPQPIYTGAIHGLAASGTARVMEQS